MCLQLILFNLFAWSSCHVAIPKRHHWLLLSGSVCMERCKISISNDVSGTKWRFREAYVSTWSSLFLSGPEVACQLSTWSGKLVTVQTRSVSAELSTSIPCFSEAWNRRINEEMMPWQTQLIGRAGCAASVISLQCTKGRNGAGNRNPSHVLRPHAWQQHV